MPIPFRDLNEDENAGVVGYLRFVDEPDGKGMRGALFVMSTRGEPIDFSFTRIDVHGGYLWRAGESRRQAVTALTKALFQSAGRVPEARRNPDLRGPFLVGYCLAMIRHIE